MFTKVNFANSISSDQLPGKNVYAGNDAAIIDSLLNEKIEVGVNSTIANLLSDPAFLDSLKEKLGINPPPDEFIDTPTVCSLLKISRTTCHNRVKARILIAHRTEGSRKVMFSRKQVLSTLKSVTILKREI